MFTKKCYNQNSCCEIGCHDFCSYICHPCIPPKPPVQTVILTGRIIGLPVVSGIIIEYIIDGISNTVITDRSGVYSFEIPEGSNVIIRPENMEGYRMIPEEIYLENVTSVVIDLYFDYVPIENNLILLRASASIPVYMQQPNKWPLHGTTGPDLYMEDKILVEIGSPNPRVVKWERGIHDVSYFISAGIDITNDYLEGIPVDQTDNYTVYVQYADGSEDIAVIAIDHIRDGSVNMPYLLLDYETANSLASMIEGTGKFILDYMQGGGEKLSAHYELYENINMTGRQWTPIGTYETYGDGFSGSLYGNNNSISNLRIQDTITEFVGLFGMIIDGSRIENLILSNCNIQGEGVAAAIAASCMMQGGYIDIINCHTDGSLTAVGQAGGMIGFLFGGEGTLLIRDCSSNMNIQGGSEVGGIAGYLDVAVGGTRVERCHSQGQLNSSVNAGGLIGYFKSSKGSYSAVLDCYNEMEVTISTHYVGGVIGLLTCQEGDILVDKCYNSGTVTGFVGVGGICGRVGVSRGGNFIISNSYSVGNCFTQTEGFYVTNTVGGVLGEMSGNEGNILLENNYCTGIVIAGNTTGLPRAGGIGGQLGSPAVGQFIIQNCAALNELVAGSSALTGRVSGDLPGANSIRLNNLALEDMEITINGVPKNPLDEGGDQVDGQSESAVAMTTESTYQTLLDWDFTTTWFWGNGAYTLPVLQSIPRSVQPTVLPPHI